jgi:hypothetical protein
VAPPPPAGPPAPLRWNVFELESRVRAVAGQDPDRDEEWRYMLLHLRDHASADGTLPPSFDSLVRESFQELVPAGR